MAARVDREHHVIVKNRGQRCEVGVVQFAGAGDVPGQQRGRGDQQVMCVPRVRGEIVVSQLAARAGLVHDRKRAVYQLRRWQRAFDLARQLVIGAARRAGDDDFDVLLRRPALRMNKRRRVQEN
jgi:hypothetical protein